MPKLDDFHAFNLFIEQFTNKQEKRSYLNLQKYNRDLVEHINEGTDNLL